MGSGLSGAAGLAGTKLLETQEITAAVAAVTFTGIDATYPVYEFHAYGLVLSGSAVPWLRFGTSGGIISGVGDYRHQLGSGTATSVSDSKIVCLGVNHTAGGLDLFVRLFNPSSTLAAKALGRVMGVNAGHQTYADFAGEQNHNNPTPAIDRVQFLLSAGTYTAGKLTMIGRRDR